ncbi:MAG: hypothetical protein KAI47_11135, partial [Deltaproteobacteria bacterium]|nr:hypothetical protein [Deltaproteobacteria bacterium]
MPKLSAKSRFSLCFGAAPYRSASFHGSLGRRRRGEALAFALVLLGAAFSFPAEAAKKPRLAVLYFDNNTSNKKLNVLQKGLADMFITDLASVPGLVVVERDKLQAVISELKLQRSRYFNKRSSVKIGKQLGATHVVSGNFAVIANTIRIGARLIEVRTGRVLLGTRVTGPTTSIFDLEQQLVQRFVAGFHKTKKQGVKSVPGAVRPGPRVGTYRPSSRGRTKIPDVATLVDYSKGLDLVDKGMLRAASLRLAAVAAKAPTFRLAKQRIGELKRRVKHAGIVRAATLGAQAKALRIKAVAFVRGHGPDAKDVQEAKLYLAYSEVLDAFARYDLSKVLAPRSPNLILPGKRRAALALVKRVINRKI